MKSANTKKSAADIAKKATFKQADSGKIDNTTLKGKRKKHDYSYVLEGRHVSLKSG